jgi:ribosomal 50S subunit-recycling heat shock protein
MKIARYVIAAMVLMAGMAMPGVAEEKKDDRPGGAIMEASTITSSVESIDYKTRTVTLKGEKGGLVSFIAGDEVRNLDQVKKGDLVTFDYYEGLAIDVQKASEAPKMVETQSVTRAKPGEKPAGTIETIGFMTATVEELDYKTRMVTLKLPEGNALRFKVGDQVKRLNEIKKGDEIVVQYKQKVTIKVTTPAKKQEAGAGKK